MTLEEVVFRHCSFSHTLASTHMCIHIYQTYMNICTCTHTHTHINKNNNKIKLFDLPLNLTLLILLKINQTMLVLWEILVQLRGGGWQTLLEGRASVEKELKQRAKTTPEGH